MKKGIFLITLFILCSSLFANDPFIGQWFWSLNGQIMTADRKECKVFTPKGEFYTMKRSSSQSSDWKKEDFQTYVVNEKENIITFHNSGGSYKFKYIIENSKYIALLDLEVQENPAIYCFKFSD